jgi:hypothetical protein
MGFCEIGVIFNVGQFFKLRVDKYKKIRISGCEKIQRFVQN